MSRLDHCAICQQQILEFTHFVTIGYGYPDPQYALCHDCAAPIILLLKESDLPSLAESEK